MNPDPPRDCVNCRHYRPGRNALCKPTGLGRCAATPGGALVADHAGGDCTDWEGLPVQGDPNVAPGAVGADPDPDRDPHMEDKLDARV